MNQFILLLVGMVALAIGSVLGYYARQSIARKQAGTLESKLKKRIDQTKQESEKILNEAKEEASQIIEAIKKEEDARRGELIKTERLLLRRESNLDARIQTLDRKENEFRQKVEKLREIKESLESLRQEALGNLERIAMLPREEAKKELLENLEKDYQQEILAKMKKLEAGGLEQYEKKAKEILALAIQKCSLSQAQEITTTQVI